MPRFLLIGLATVTAATSADARTGVEHSCVGHGDVPATTKPLPVVVSLVVDAPAEADGTLAIADLAVHDAGNTAIGTLTLAPTAPNSTVATVTISLPRGARIVAMTYDTGGEAGAVAAGPLAIATARRALDRAENPPTVVAPRALRDPALLAYLRSNDVFDRYQLTVFPISKQPTTVVTIAFAMPAFDTLHAALGDRRVELTSDELPQATDDEFTLSPRAAAVDATTSLYAEPLRPIADAHTLAALLADVSPQLRSCAAADSQYSAQDVAVTLSVDARGHVASAHLGGADAELAECLRQFTAYVRFRPGYAAELHTTLRVEPTGW
jgi:hypothetical protein